MSLEEAAGKVLADHRKTHELVGGKELAAAGVITALQFGFTDVEVQHLLEEGIQLGFGQRLVALTYAAAEGFGRAP